MPSKPSNTPTVPTDPKSAHMAKRKSQGLTHAEVASEFGTSKSTAHRRVSKAKAATNTPPQDTLRQGYTKQ